MGSINVSSLGNRNERLAGKPIEEKKKLNVTESWLITMMLSNTI